MNVTNLQSTEVDMSISTPFLSRRKPYAGLQMEGLVARWYAHITRARRDHRQTAQAIAAQLPGGGAVLEVAPGPGYMAVELARLGAYSITGLDISHAFVRIAANNAVGRASRSTSDTAMWPTSVPGRRIRFRHVHGRLQELPRPRGRP
jgi:SAM-dependent methyltransferase